MAPDAATGVNAVHDESGVGTLPPRMLIVRLSDIAIPIMLFQSTVVPPSNARERNEPDDAYGDIGIESTTTLPLIDAISLAATGRNGPATVIVCVTMSIPST